MASPANSYAVCSDLRCGDSMLQIRILTLRTAAHCSCVTGGLAAAFSHSEYAAIDPDAHCGRLSVFTVQPDWNS